MYKIEDAIIYNKEVCRIKQIIPKYYQDKDYYVLYPVYDTSLTIKAPIDSPLIRNIITQDSAKKLIDSIADILPINLDDKMLEKEYKQLLNSGELSDLVKIIKTTYLRNDKRLQAGKKKTEIDNKYFIKSEQLLYNELAIALKMDVDQVKEYIIKIANQK